MAKDKLVRHRAKSRLILELRYPPLLQAFDKRGALLEALSNQFKHKMDDWHTDNVTVNLFDDRTAPRHQISVDHRHCVLAYEDPGTIQEFYDDGKRLIQLLDKIFPSHWNAIDRIGVRFISILRDDSFASFTSINEKVMNTFFIPRVPLSLTITDCQAVLEHETGRVCIGPVRKGEAWALSMFTLPDTKVPDIGFGVDVDSYVSNPKIESTSEIVKLFYTVFEQTVLTEQEVATALGIGTKNG